MMIYVNGQEYAFSKEQDLLSFFSELGIDVNAGIAIAVNEVVIPKLQWNTFSLKEQDKILLIKATQGG